MLNFSDEDRGVSSEAREIYASKLLHGLRDDIADVYWQIFQPESEYFSKEVNERIERLMSYLSYAISLHLNDFDGWEETEDTIREFNHIFFYPRKKKDNGNPKLSERMQQIKEKEKEEDDNIPF